MLKAHSQFHSFREGSYLRASLLRIMHNGWITNHRMTLHPRPNNSVLRSSTGSTLRHAPPGCRSAEVQALEALPERRVIQALQALPDNLRMTPYYADVGGYRYREIAQIMDIPIGTVMSRLHTRARLRALLVELGHERARSWSTTAPN